MKILYAIQGTGNGHLSRAKEIYPYLKRKGEVDLLVSGIQSDIELPFPVKFKFKGMSYIFGKKGGIDYFNTYLKNHVNHFMKEVKSLPIEDYDLIINDFEPISAWAAYLKKKNCISLSNQCAVLSKHSPKSKKEDVLGKFMLNNYAPTTSQYGFHFQSYSPQIYTPIIRKEIRALKVNDKGHYLVYLPAYDNERILKKLKQIPNTQFHVFSKHSKDFFQDQNVKVQPINNEDFLISMASCHGVICAAGFATPSETLYLGKKLMVIPMKAQYEQQCNAVALKGMGIKVVPHLRKKYLEEIKDWILNGTAIKVNYPNKTNLIIDTIIANEYLKQDSYLDYIMKDQYQTAH